MNTYRGYRIERSGDNYVVRTPKGARWAEIAVNRATARRWIDAAIAEQQALARAAVAATR